MRSWFSLCLLLCCAATARAAVTLVDDQGQALTLGAPAVRIIALSPHVAELLFDVGAGGKLVGTVSRSDYPAAARNVALVGDHARLDVERIIALNPDAVVAWGGGNPPLDIERLRQLGVPVLVLEPRHLDDVARHLELLGQLAGTETQARAAAADYRHGLAALRERYAGRSMVTVFYQVWHAPLMTVGGEQIISEVISLCGGQNIFAALRSLAPTVSVESVVMADPALIVTASDQPVAQALANWRAWPMMRAVRIGQLMTISPNNIARATPRLLQGAQEMCEAIEGARAVPWRVSR